MKANNKKLFLTLGIILLVLAAAIFIWAKYFSGYDIDKLEQEMYKLPTDVTETELEEMGYINVSDIQQSKNLEIEKFIQCAIEGREKVLRIQLEEEGEWRTKIYYVVPEAREVRVSSYTPKEQHGEAPNKRFSNDIERIEENGVVSIKLKNVKDTSIPEEQADWTPADEILYSYYEGE